jgi:hypothetical protein
METHIKQTGSGKAPSEFRVNEVFNKGDVLRISGRKCKKGEGLSYPDMTVIALEDGAIGGWDVYDGQRNDGSEVSFYGFSII